MLLDQKSTNNAVICSYCKKTGHVFADCKQHERDIEAMERLSTHEATKGKTFMAMCAFPNIAL